MSISTILLAVAVVVEFIAVDYVIKLLNKTSDENESLLRENAELEIALLDARRQISKLHKRNRRKEKYGNI